MKVVVKPVQDAKETEDGKKKLADVELHDSELGIKIVGGAVWQRGKSARTPGISVTLPATKTAQGEWFEFFTTIETGSRAIGKLKADIRAEYERQKGSQAA